MTCLMLTTLIQKGELSWQTTIRSAFPELRGSIDSGFKKTTLWQLVSHRSGMRREPPSRLAYPDLPLVKRRYLMMKDVVTSPPEILPGNYQYSNLAFLVASAMAEKESGKSWEELMVERVFSPLGMTTAGFGPPHTEDTVDQPWGHRWVNDKLTPRAYNSNPSMYPGGGVHCSLNDWAKFISLYLPKRKLSPRTKAYVKQLTTPRNTDEYAGGIRLLERSWGRGKVLNHGGLTGGWTVRMWIAPNIDRAYIAAINVRQRKEETYDPLGDIIMHMISSHQ